MSTLVRRTEGPLSELFSWLDLNRPSSLSDLTHYIPVQSYTEAGTYVVRADLPGVDPGKDIDVKVDGDVLVIRCERQEEHHENGHSEVRCGSFSRNVRLPKGANLADVAARYDAGVLVVTIPMAEALTEPMTVPVERGGGL